MSFWKIAWRNIEQRALASSLTGLSMALGVAVMIAVIVIHSVAVKQFEQDAQGYDWIVGGKTGSLQLVLTTVYHVGQSLYPIPYSYYQKFLPGGEYADVTEVAVPVCLGDSYEAPSGSLFRVVATTPDMFDKLEYGREEDGTPKRYAFQRGGRNFEADHFFEAVVGSIVARRADLKVGDEINPTHGISGEGHKHDSFKVVGILEPTGTSNDRAVFINIEGFYLLEGHALAPKESATPANGDHDHERAHEDENKSRQPDEHEHEHGEESKNVDGARQTDVAATGLADEHSDEHGDDHSDEHDHEHHTPLPIEQREVTSILVLCKDPLASQALDMAINKSEDRIAQAVRPTREVTILLEKIIAPVRVILLVLTVLIIVVAGISILVSIYNSMSERAHDIAVMRALGASRAAVMTIVLVESILLSLGGGLIGVLLGHALIGLASPYVVAQTGVSLHMFQFDPRELWLIPGLIVLASLVGFLPALAAYRTDVAKALASGR
jgi:putative ABC transport system permease protein